MIMAFLPRMSIEETDDTCREREFRQFATDPNGHRRVRLPYSIICLMVDNGASGWCLPDSTTAWNKWHQR
jgi:hypothetical protein